MELFALAEKLDGNLELAIKRLAESKKKSPIINNLKIRNMKWIDNLIYTLLSACLLAGCEDSGSKEPGKDAGAIGYTSGDTRLSHSRKRAADTPSPGKRMSGAEYWKRLTR